MSLFCFTQIHHYRQTCKKRKILVNIKTEMWRELLGGTLGMVDNTSVVLCQVLPFNTIKLSLPFLSRNDFFLSFLLHIHSNTIPVYYTVCNLNFQKHKILWAELHFREIAVTILHGSGRSETKIINDYWKQFNWGWQWTYCQVGRTPPGIATLPQAPPPLPVCSLSGAFLPPGPPSWYPERAGARRPLFRRLAGAITVQSRYGRPEVWWHMPYPTPFQPDRSSPSENSGCLDNLLFQSHTATGLMVFWG